ncbi:MAG: Wadjet anti-phage system protein JetD domain-containing protein, partial [Succinivibrio sp.]
LRHPSSQDIARDFAAARAFAGYWSQAKGLSVELSAMPTRRFGPQNVPTAACFDSAASAAAFIGKDAELGDYLAMRERFTARFPRLATVFDSRPIEMLRNRGCADLLMAVAEFLAAHPRPGIYVREADIRGVDTKFIENHCRVLGLILDETLPPDAIDENFRPNSREFALRYGFRQKPPRVRFRLLDPDDRIGSGDQWFYDMEVDAGSFASMNPSCMKAVICENETTYLTLPRLRGTIAICGSGCGFDALKGAKWLSRLDTVYWGDLDTRGFAVLNNLRKSCPFMKVRSAMMDLKTLQEFQDLCVQEPKQSLIEPETLTDAEFEAFEALRDNRYGKSLRLEQERIPYSRSCEALKKALFG